MTNAPSTEQNARGPGGRWLPGHTPQGATPFKPGQSGNPKGRPSAGAAVIEWLNELQNSNEDELDAIVSDKTNPLPKRAAAIQWLTILADAADIADFATYLDGTESLADLKRRGVRVRRLKKIRGSITTNARGEKVINLDVELSERGGRVLDRIMDRTHGRPRQQIELRQSITVAPVDELQALNDEMVRLGGVAAVTNTHLDEAVLKSE
jgi:hypothetical protein